MCLKAETGATVFEVLVINSKYKANESYAFHGGTFISELLYQGVDPFGFVVVAVLFLNS